MAAVSGFDRLWLLTLTMKLLALHSSQINMIFQNQKNPENAYKLKEGKFRLNIRKNLFNGGGW